MGRVIDGIGDVDELLAKSRAREDEARQQLLGRCRTSDDVLDELRPLLPGHRELLLAQGEYSPSPSTARRWFVLAVGDGGAHELCSAWLAQAERENLAASLRAAHDLVEGTCDAMYATAWTLAWSEASPGSCRVWSRSGLRCVVADGSVTWAAGLHRLPAERVEAVEGFVGEDWVRRELRLRLRGGGRKIRLARVDEPLSALDVTYGALELMCDAAWLQDLARELAEALGVPAECHDELGGVWLPERLRQGQGAGLPEAGSSGSPRKASAP